MKNPFAIRRDERRPAFVALLLAALLQVVMVVYRYDLSPVGATKVIGISSSTISKYRDSTP